MSLLDNRSRNELLGRGEMAAPFTGVLIPSSEAEIQAERRLQIWNQTCDQDPNFVRGLALRLLNNGYKVRMKEIRESAGDSFFERFIKTPFMSYKAQRLNNLAVDAVLKGTPEFLKAIGKDFFISLRDDAMREEIAEHLQDICKKS